MQFSTPIAILGLLLQLLSTVSGQGIQFAIKNNFFNDVKSNYLPLAFDHIGQGYDIGSYTFGSRWANVNLTESKLSLPGNDRYKFANDFTVVPPQPGTSKFGLKMNKVSVDLESNYTARFLISYAAGHISAVISNIDIDLEVELDTQEGFQKKLAPKVNINKINIGVDKKETKIEITGGAIPYMVSFIERMIQGPLIDYAIKELKTELETNFLDDLNKLVVKYLQNVYLADHIGFDVSLNEKPNDLNGTFMLDLNGTFLIEDPETHERKYAASSGEGLSLAAFQNKLDADVAFALNADTVSQALKLLYQNNKTINIGEILKVVDPSVVLDCASAFAARLPNMQFDEDCIGDTKYPISIEVSLPTEPHDAFVKAADNTAGLVLDSMRLRAVRTDTDELIMDFVLEDFQANISLALNEMWQTDFNYNIKFNNAKVVERGYMVKAERDIWQLSGELNNGNDIVQDAINGAFTFRYTLGITNRKAAMKWDEETKSFFVGVTPDPVFLGYNQF